jgi:hypothetical protein
LKKQFIGPMMTTLRAQRQAITTQSGPRRLETMNNRSCACVPWLAVSRGATSS